MLSPAKVYLLEYCDGVNTIWYGSASSRHAVRIIGLVDTTASGARKAADVDAAEQGEISCLGFS
jgi:hypothetical protein